MEERKLHSQFVDTILNRYQVIKQENRDIEPPALVFFNPDGREEAPQPPVRSSQMLVRLAMELNFIYQTQQHLSIHPVNETLLKRIFERNAATLSRSQSIRTLHTEKVYQEMLPSGELELFKRQRERAGKQWDWLRNTNALQAFVQRLNETESKLLLETLERQSVLQLKESEKSEERTARETLLQWSEQAHEQQAIIRWLEQRVLFSANEEKTRELLIRHRESVRHELERERRKNTEKQLLQQKVLDKRTLTALLPVLKEYKEFDRERKTVYRFLEERKEYQALEELRQYFAEEQSLNAPVSTMLHHVLHSVEKDNYHQIVVLAEALQSHVTEWRTRSEVLNSKRAVVPRLQSPLSTLSALTERELTQYSELLQKTQLVQLPEVRSLVERVSKEAGISSPVYTQEAFEQVLLVLRSESHKSEREQLLQLTRERMGAEAVQALERYFSEQRTTLPVATPQAKPIGVTKPITNFTALTERELTQYSELLQKTQLVQLPEVRSLVERVGKEAGASAPVYTQEAFEQVLLVLRSESHKTEREQLLQLTRERMGADAVQALERYFSEQSNTQTVALPAKTPQAKPIGVTKPITNFTALTERELTQYSELLQKTQLVQLPEVRSLVERVGKEADAFSPVYTQEAFEQVLLVLRSESHKSEREQLLQLTRERMGTEAGQALERYFSEQSNTQTVALPVATPQAKPIGVTKPITNFTALTERELTQYSELLQKTQLVQLPEVRSLVERVRKEAGASSPVYTQEAFEQVLLVLRSESHKSEREQLLQLTRERMGADAGQALERYFSEQSNTQTVALPAKTPQAKPIGVTKPITNFTALTERELTQYSELFQKTQLVQLPEVRSLVERVSKEAGASSPVYTREAFEQVLLVLRSESHKSEREQLINLTRERMGAEAGQALERYFSEQRTTQAKPISVTKPIVPHFTALTERELTQYSELLQKTQIVHLPEVRSLVERVSKEAGASSPVYTQEAFEQVLLVLRSESHKSEREQLLQLTRERMGAEAVQELERYFSEQSNTQTVALPAKTPQAKPISVTKPITQLTALTERELTQYGELLQKTQLVQLPELRSLVERVGKEAGVSSPVYTQEAFEQVLLVLRSESHKSEREQLLQLTRERMGAEAVQELERYFSEQSNTQTVALPAKTPQAKPIGVTKPITNFTALTERELTQYGELLQKTQLIQLPEVRSLVERVGKEAGASSPVYTQESFEQVLLVLRSESHKSEREQLLQLTRERMGADAVQELERYFSEQRTTLPVVTTQAKPIGVTKPITQLTALTERELTQYSELLQKTQLVQLPEVRSLVERVGKEAGASSPVYTQEAFEQVLLVLRSESHKSEREQLLQLTRERMGTEAVQELERYFSEQSNTQTVALPATTPQAKPISVTKPITNFTALTERELTQYSELLQKTQIVQLPEVRSLVERVGKETGVSAPVYTQEAFEQVLLVLRSESHKSEREQLLQLTRERMGADAGQALERYFSNAIRQMSGTQETQTLQERVLKPVLRELHSIRPTMTSKHTAPSLRPKVLKNTVKQLGGGHQSIDLTLRVQTEQYQAQPQQKIQNVGWSYREQVRNDLRSTEMMFRQRQSAERQSEDNESRFRKIEETLKVQQTAITKLKVEGENTPKVTQPDVQALTRSITQRIANELKLEKMRRGYL